MYIKSKLSFVGISQADMAGLEKAPRWAKIWSKSFQTKACLDFVIPFLSLSPTFELCSRIFCSYYLYVRYDYYNGSIFGFSKRKLRTSVLILATFWQPPVTGSKQKQNKKLGQLWLGPMLMCPCWQKRGTAFRLVSMQQTHSLLKREKEAESGRVLSLWAAPPPVPVAGEMHNYYG